MNIKAALSNTSKTILPFYCPGKVICIFSEKVICVAVVRQAEIARFLRTNKLLDNVEYYITQFKIKIGKASNFKALQFKQLLFNMLKFCI